MKHPGCAEEVVTDIHNTASIAYQLASDYDILYIVGGVQSVSIPLAGFKLTIFMLWRVRGSATLPDVPFMRYSSQECSVFGRTTTVSLRQPWLGLQRNIQLGAMYRPRHPVGRLPQRGPGAPHLRLLRRRQDRRDVQPRRRRAVGCPGETARCICSSAVRREAATRQPPPVAADTKARAGRNADVLPILSCASCTW